MSGNVYYGVFSFQCGLFEPIEKYIILSNEEIKLKKSRLTDTRVMFRVDKEKQIVIPYQARTQYFPDNKDWIYQHIE